MYMGGHGVPHCHVTCNENAASFAISNDELLAGQMPLAQTKKIQEFIKMNRTELMEKWNELSG
jgi:hypothetical protein